VKKLLLAGVAVAAAVTSASACELTYEKYRALKMGSTYEDVVKVIGCQGVEQSRHSGYPDDAEHELVSYEWRMTGEVSGTIHGDFTGNRLEYKSQYGLEPEAGA
jgi:hypothetical protein